jgi:hypothetical protein
VGSFYGEPHKALLKQSSNAYYTVQHNRDVDVRAFDIKCISAVVIMAPDPRYPAVFHDGSEVNHWFMAPKPGHRMAMVFGWETEQEDDDNGLD